MKERFITAFLMVSMCVALHGSGTTSYLRAQQRQLRMDNLTMLSAAGGQENNITRSSIPTKETTTMMTMTERVDNGTMLEGDKVVLLSQNNASNVTILTHSPPQAEDINVTIDNMTNNWMTPVTLNSSLSIEETLIETNHTSTSSTELDKSNSTNNNITLEVMSSTLVPPQLSETALEETDEEEDESSSNNNVTNTTITTPDLVLATFNATATYAPTTSSSSTPTVAQSIINSPTVNPTPLLLDTAAPSNGFDTTTSAPTSTPTDVQTSLNPSSANPTPQLDSAAVSVSPTSTPTIVQIIRSPTFNHAQQSDAPKMSNLDLYNATSSKNSTSSKPTVQPTQDYDDDYDYDYHYYDDGPPFTYDDDKSANITSTIPAPRPTYSPTTTAEANDAIYTIYHPTYQKKKEEVANSPTYSPTEPYPTYSPTTTRKGKRVRKRQNKRDKNTTKKRPRKRNAAPTGSPTVVEMEFLEDVSASKTIPLVIGVVLTILGIGCCAWCV